jgi:two-component system response regulator YesN
MKEPHYLTLSLGVSRRTTGMEQLKTAYAEAELALKHTLLESASVVRFDNISDLSTDYAVPTETIKRISNMLGTGREQEMKRLLYEVLDIHTVKRYEIGYLEAVSRAMNEQVFDKVFHVYGEESVIILTLYKKVGDIYQFRRFHDYVHTLESLLDRLNEYIKTMKSVHVDHREMKAAVDYIQANYQRDLNMATVSNHVSLNYSYFSQTFKEYTGLSFVQYIKTVRIEKAKELLEKTELKVFEIGTMVGFENSKHFNRVFREMEGVTPLEYRTTKAVLP